MDTIFSTREIATAIWLIIFIICCFASPKIRKSAACVIKTFCTPKLFIPFVLMLVYAALIVLVLTFLPFWKWIYIKDISIWVLIAGIPSCYKAIGKKTNENQFQNMILDTLKFAVLVEFVISSFTFSLVAELLIQPAVLFLVLLDAVAGTKTEYKPAKKLTSCLMILAGIAVIGFTLKEAVNSYQTLGAFDLLVSFFTPIAFSFLYVPVAYGFVIYAKYDTLFVRMSFYEPMDKKIRHYHRKAVLSACGLSYKRIDMLQQEYIGKMYVNMNLDEFDDLIKRFKSSNM